MPAPRKPDRTVTGSLPSTMDDAVVVIAASVLHVVQVQANEAEGRGVLDPLGKRAERSSRRGWSAKAIQAARSPQRSQGVPETLTARRTATADTSRKAMMARHQGGGAAQVGGLSDKQERRGHTVNHAQETGGAAPTVSALMENELTRVWIGTELLPELLTQLGCINFDPINAGQNRSTPSLPHSGIRMRPCPPGCCRPVGEGVNKTTVYCPLDRLETMARALLHRRGQRPHYAKCRTCYGPAHTHNHPHFHCTSCDTVRSPTVRSA